MKPLLIVSDLDGTLLDSRTRVTDRTREAVQAVRKAGHTFVIATARPVRDVRPIAEALGHTGVAVCGNGSLAYDFGLDEVVDHRPIAQDAARTALAALRGGMPGVRLGTERWPELLLEDDFALDPRYCADARRVRALEDELDERGFGKLIVQADGTAPDYHRTVADLLPNGFEVTLSSGQFCEVTRAGVDKATGLARLAARLGLSSADTIAFGDMPNDLPMLAWAGRSVAVANAHAEVLAAVDEVTFSHDEDGVARYLERLVGTGC
ncbi:HAD family hydrolase [Streptomyces cinnamoneus]|uniref:Haloacid dehalogenase n=1 Tax=Streptomyces cinnamoneus TaxID=53446 RepID=A0A918WKL3_STRCJ|nr:Cof-type HAD-IIB family hydrolase [Streptomyces cinnamoneus]GHC55115.1 haloacid dehalogenase [Streptomyces cinnamoneus]